ncbi:MAG: hypothetical protein PHP61_03645 [Candidatus Izemoplasmatales bacterium]|nr:hypothetical protein [Candidatus Izemoplasmatales bacterium]NLF48185.1 hypothetical protein [Acholeplasmataceae bacterium]MDD4354978.1 hypothetical protein [Candidatus Izemoplasmatales bacterium]MDD4988004.1 hypothetical protein [Candidatus Izemoplasmatales bacterium]MDD5602008.1 hypothetical protein [Candidatus Izemoplasmatales bacterium]
MRKKLAMIFALLLAVFTLTGCWYGEIGVDTVFDTKAGGGTRTIVLDVMDDTLSTTPIPNPDDPEGVESKGAVINNKHITGGLPAIQTWLEENAPDFITVEAMTTDGYHRYFTMTYTFDDFDDFLDKYELLVDLSPTMDWDDFDAEDKPTWTCSGSTCTFSESKDIVNATMDWAVDGIYNDIYNADDLTGYVTKNDISVLANYTLTIGEEEYEELQHFDPAAVDGDGTGKMIYVTSPTLELSGELPMSTGIIVLIVAGVVVVAGGVVVLVLFLGKKKVAA